MLYLARKSKEEKMEACYNLFLQANWDLTKFYNDTDLFVEDVRNNAREYAKNVLCLNLTKEQIWCLTPTNVRICFNAYGEIIKQMLKENIVEIKNLTDLDWIIDNLKESICKFCFDVCEREKWINIEIDHYCNSSNIPSKTLKKLAREYSLDILKWDDETRELYKNKKLSYRKEYNFSNIGDNAGIYANLFIRLLDINDENEIIKTFCDFNKKFAVIKHGLSNFVTSYNLPSEIKDDLFRKLEIYKEYLLSNRKQIRNEQKQETNSKKLSEAKKIISDYISSTYSSVEEYCTNLDLNKREFEKYLSLIKLNENKLYVSFVEHEEQINNESYNGLLSNVSVVIDLLKNGVVDNNVKREFDLVDYYKYLPVGFYKMLRTVREDLNLEDYKLLSEFVNENKNEEELSEVAINNIYNTKTIVGAQFDEENNIIIGTGREITREEKQNIINYLKNNKIPVTKKTYNIIYRRWLSGGLVINEEEKTKKK